MLKETINTATIDPAIARLPSGVRFIGTSCTPISAHEKLPTPSSRVSRTHCEMRVCHRAVRRLGTLARRSHNRLPGDGSPTTGGGEHTRARGIARVLRRHDHRTRCSTAHRTASRLQEKVGNPGRFAWALVKARPSIGLAICARIEHDPQSVLLSVLPVVIACLAEAQPDDVIAMVEALLETSDLAIRRSVAALSRLEQGRTLDAPGG